MIRLNINNTLIGDFSNTDHATDVAQIYKQHQPDISIHIEHELNGLEASLIGLSAHTVIKYDII